MNNLPVVHGKKCNNKQLLDEVFVISGIVKVEVSVISQSQRLRLITLTETLIIPGMTNRCAVIVFFSVRILQYGPFSWKRSNPYIFVLEQSRRIQNLQPRQRKKRCENCHSSN